jgi:hypothetical protein
MHISFWRETRKRLRLPVCVCVGFARANFWTSATTDTHSISRFSVRSSSRLCQKSVFYKEAAIDQVLLLRRPIPFTTTIRSSSLRPSSRESSERMSTDDVKNYKLQARLPVAPKSPLRTQSSSTIRVAKRTVPRTDGTADRAAMRYPLPHLCPSVII